MTETLTPQQVADRAGCGRTRVVKALQKRELHATKDNLGRWHIAPEDADKWSSEYLTPRVRAATPRDAGRDTDAVARIAALETETRMLSERIDEIAADRDAWRELATRPGPVIRFFQSLRKP